MVYFNFNITEFHFGVAKEVAPLWQQTNKQFKKHKMKTTITNFLFGAALLMTGQLFGQSIQSQENVNFDDLKTSSFSDVVNPGSQGDFKAVIFPNPTLTGKVKITWPDWADVTLIQLIHSESGWVKDIDIAEEQKGIAVHDLNEGVYIVRFFRKNELLGSRKLRVIS
jgi:hypothetical protein|tara:strand:+ start:12491 stop:12991 length:501 start_codon:yes stop_codon:yes gene_type:complete